LIKNSGVALPTSKNELLQGRAREAGGGEVEGVGMERGESGVMEGFGTLVRVEGGWGGEGGGEVDGEGRLDSSFSMESFRKATS